jgi:hypothetical protein
MQDWLLIAAPVVAVGYFLDRPDQLQLIMDWLARLLR